MATETTTDANRTDTVRATLARLTGGEVYGCTAVKIDGSARELRIMVDSDGITLSTHGGIETLPSGLTYRQIADHALAAANGAPSTIGEVITNRDYRLVMGG